MSSYLVVLVITVCGPLIAFQVYDIARQSRERHEQAATISYHAARAIAGEVAQFVRATDRGLAFLATRPKVRALDPADCDPMIKILQTARERIANVLTVDVDGRLICSAAGVDPVRPQQVDPKYWLGRVRETGKPVIGQPARGFITGMWVVTMAHPLRDDAGKIVGAAAMAMDLARFHFSQEGLQAPEGTTITILSGEGVVIARSAEAEAWLGRNVAEYEPAHVVLARRSGILRSAGLDGIERDYGFTPIEGTQWIALAGVPAAAANAKVREATLVASAAALLTLLIAVFLGWLIARRIALPVRTLANVVRKIAAGDGSVRAPLAGPREITGVAVEFNRMLEVQRSQQQALRESEEKLRLFVKHAPSAIAMFDRDMRYVAFSRRWLRDYNLGDQDLTGRSHYDVFPDLPERWKETHRRCLAGAVEKAEEDPFPRGDGLVDWVRWEAHPWRASDGGIDGLIVFSEVITERKRAEQQQSAENSVLESMGTGQPLAAILDTIARNVEALSPGTLCSILLLDADGAHVRSGAAPSLPEEFNRAIDGQPIGPKAGSCGTAAYRNEQVIVTDIATDPLWADYAGLALALGLRACWSTPVRSGAGKVLGTFALYYREPRSPSQADFDLIERWTHLTGIAIERRRAEDEIRELNEGLERRVAERTEQLIYANRAKDSFLATMSHEIRTPLSGLLGMLELLALSPLDAEQRETLRAARDSGRGLSRIVDDILDWSKIEAGKLELAPTATSITRLVTGVVNTYSRIASAKGLTLRQYVDPGISPALVLDPLRISQVLNNFVSNALKFTSVGEVEIRAEALGREDGMEHVRFSVRDTGIGIDKEHQERLFQSYEQAQAETTRLYGGTGLGLAICRRLADMMNGKIELQSTPGRGSVFSLTLNLSIAEQPAQPDQPKAPEEPEGGPSFEPLVAGVKAPVVLIVDDHPINRALLARQLKLLGLRTETADNGIQALPMWRNGRFDLVITDCHMPEMDGYVLTRAIRELERREKRPRGPIIAWTANVLAEEAERCRAAGMDDLLTKPTDLARLKMTLEKWLRATEKPAADKASAASSEAMAGKDPAIDFAQLMQVATDSAEQLEILREFQSHNRVQIGELKQALSARDLPAAVRGAHRMKGASRMVGAGQIAAVCATIEEAARRGDVEAALAAGTLLEGAVERFDSELAKSAGRSWSS